MKLISVRETCDRLGCSRTTLWKLRKRLDFPRARRLGSSRIAFIDSEIDEYIERLPTDSAAERVS